MSTLYRARVVRMDAEGVFVEIPDLGEGNEWGPLEMPPVVLALGDPVIVGSINEILEDLALIAKLVTVAVEPPPANLTQAYYFENEAARTAAGLSPSSGMTTWLDDEQRLDVYTDEAPAGWVSHYGVKNNILKLPQATKIGVGTATPGAPLELAAAASTDGFLASRVSGNAQPRLTVRTDGRMEWGPGGSTATDVFFYRADTNQLRIDGNFVVFGGITAWGNILTDGSIDIGRGIFNYVDLTSVVGSIGTSQTTVATFPSKTYKAGRAYKFKAAAGFNPSSTSAFCDLRLWKTLNVTGVAEMFRFPSGASGSYYAANGEVLFKVGGSDVTASLVIGASASTGTLQFFGDAGNARSQFWIEDVGAASQWPTSNVLA